MYLFHADLDHPRVAPITGTQEERTGIAAISMPHVQVLVHFMLEYRMDKDYSHAPTGGQGV